ncbi:methyltransferase domain-containing protein [Kitasatospora sp. NPDC088783]|uniref:methyltransferase domain-containing protein n=1 Tax=Kitasatospora sp. NPDC088783 TaxID=3364077 RepID=UPI00382CEBC0
MRTNDAQMLVLSALADGPLHGYAVNTAIERMTGTRLGRGSLSGALARLRDKQLIEYLPGEGRRRPVRLTAEGRGALDRELHALADVAGQLFETVVPDRIAYQERLNRTDQARAYQRVLLDALDARPGQLLLDWGCGTGAALPALARAATARGRVLGIDHDPRMARRAAERTADLPGTAVLRADVHRLPLAPGSADRIRTDRLFQHLADPAVALAEAHRVLRPGGRLVAAEPDWDTLAVDHPDPELSRAFTRHLTDRIVRNPLIGRQLPRLAEHSGLAVRTVAPVTTLFRDVREADRVLGLRRNTERAVTANHLTARQARDWLDHLAHGPFLAAVTVFVVTAERTAAGAEGVGAGRRSPWA